MSRALIIPAAGAGSRLKSDLPKPLVPVNGQSMIGHLVDLYRPFVEHVILVVAPSAASAIEGSLHGRGIDIRYAVQQAPTGMLDAILIPRETVADLRPDAIWITWSDQVAIDPRTVAALAATERQVPRPDLAFPTVQRRHPYTHLVRDSEGGIQAVLHRREGDAIPEVGESEAGLFALSPRAYHDLLPHYAASIRPGPATSERNFVPFIGWMRPHGPVATYPLVDEMEAVGINTVEELKAVQAYLLRRRESR